MTTCNDISAKLTPKLDRSMPLSETIPACVELEKTGVPMEEI